MGAPSKNIGNQLQSQNVHNLTYVSAAWFQMTDCNSGTASSETLKKDLIFGTRKSLKMLSFEEK